MLNKIKKYFCKTMSIYENGKLRVPAQLWLFVSTITLIFLYALIVVIIDISTKIYESITKGTFITEIIAIVLSDEFLGIVIFTIVVWGIILLGRLYMVQIVSFLSRFDLVCKRIEPSENIKKIASDIENLSHEERKQFRTIMPAILRKLGE